MTHVLVLGGGPAGYVAALRAAQLGARVTLVESRAWTSPGETRYSSRTWGP